MATSPARTQDETGQEWLLQALLRLMVLTTITNIIQAHLPPNPLDLVLTQRTLILETATWVWAPVLVKIPKLDLIIPVLFTTVLTRQVMTTVLIPLVQAMVTTNLEMPLWAWALPVLPLPMVLTSTTNTAGRQRLRLLHDTLDLRLTPPTQIPELLLLLGKIHTTTHNQAMPTTSPGMLHLALAPRVQLLMACTNTTSTRDKMRLLRSLSGPVLTQPTETLELLSAASTTILSQALGTILEEMPHWQVPALQELATAPLVSHGTTTNHRLASAAKSCPRTLSELDSTAVPTVSHQQVVL